MKFESHEAFSERMKPESTEENNLKSLLEQLDGNQSLTDETCCWGTETAICILYPPRFRT